MAVPEVCDACSEVMGLEDLVYGRRGDIEEGLVAPESCLAFRASARTTGTLERTAVAKCLQVLAITCGGEFGPYAAQGIDVLDRLALGFHPSVRRAALGALGACVNASVEWYTTPLRDGAEGDDAVHSKTEEVADVAVMACVLALRDEDDAAAAVGALDSLGDIVSVVGPRFMADYIKRVFPLLRDVMEGNAACQKEGGQFEDLFGAASRCLLSFATTFGGPRDFVSRRTDGDESTGEVMTPYTKTFDEFLDEVFPSLLLWCSPKQDGGVRRLGIGTIAGLAETFEEEGSFDRYARFSVPLAKRALRDASDAADWRLARNAVFYIGEVVVQSDADDVKRLCCATARDVIMLGRNETADGFARDNAAACMAKLIASVVAGLKDEDKAEMVVDPLPPCLWHFLS